MQCKDCDKRYSGCHDHCEAYQKQLALRIEQKRWLRRQRAQVGRHWIKSSFGRSIKVGGDR